MHLQAQILRDSMHILHVAPCEFTGWILQRLAHPLERPLAALDLRLHLYTTKEHKMLWTICVVLLVLWALGMATAYTASGLIHILLVIALIVMVIRLIQGRRLSG